MATQEPDRGSRRRWFRLPGLPSEPKEEAVREEPEAQLSSDPMPVDPPPTGGGGFGDHAAPSPATPVPAAPSAPTPVPAPPAIEEPVIEEPVAAAPPVIEPKVESPPEPEAPTASEPVP